MTAITEIEASNSLADLAARIKAEHEAIKVSLRESVQHAFAAGELLIEAKKQLKHGQWLPRLRDHCTISERTAQLYMRCAKSRAEIEKSATGIADLSLTEAAAMLVMSSNVKKLTEFMAECQGMSGEEIVQAALDKRVALMGVIEDKGYRIFAHCTPEGERDWYLFIPFLSAELGWYPEGAACHVEYLSQKQFMDPDEWLGEEGERFRKGCFTAWTKMGEGILRSWAAFKERYSGRTQAEIIAETEALDKEHGPLPMFGATPRPRRRRANAQRALRIS